VLVALLVGGLGGLGGVVLMIFLIDVDHFTSSNELRTGCHSMTYADEIYRGSTHFSSSSGVRASCGECHVLDQRTFKRDAWNRMVEKELGLEPGSAERMLAGDLAIAGTDSPSIFSNKANLWSAL
jgi:nitrate/TMAO reductase-like tetraheme cytochrome c subunit